MQPDPKRIVQHEVISSTCVLISVKPEDGRGSAAMISHKEALRFAKAMLDDLQDADPPHA